VTVPWRHWQGLAIIIAMNKATLATVLADKVGVTKKQAEELLDVMVDVIIKELQSENEVTITGFGTFSSFVRKGREGVNPQKPEEKIKIMPTKVARFKPGSTLKKAMKVSSSAATPAV